jgi:hypothetical protein
MRKFFVGVIQRGQPEQSYNAAALLDIGVPVFKRLTPATMTQVKYLFDDESDRLARICAGDMEEVYPDNTKEIVEGFVRRCLETRHSARSRTVPTLSPSSFDVTEQWVPQSPPLLEEVTPVVASSASSPSE